MSKGHTIEPIQKRAMYTKQTYSLLFIFTTHYTNALITSAIMARQFSTCCCLLTAIFLRGFGIGLRVKPRPTLEFISPIFYILV